MKYTIVWSENKTEGIILSGEDRLKDAEHASGINNRLIFGVSSLADAFRENQYEKFDNVTIQDGLVPMQPTPCMIHAGQSEFYRCKDRGLTAPESVINI